MEGEDLEPQEEPSRGKNAIVGRIKLRDTKRNGNWSSRASDKGGGQLMPVVRY